MVRFLQALIGALRQRTGWTPRRRTSFAVAVVAAAAVAVGTSGSSAATKPTNTGLPVINNLAPKMGDLLSTSNGTWTGATSFAYQWRRCNTSGGSCSNISGATNNTYTVVKADSGRTLRVVVTAKNTAGSTAATSGPTAAVLGPPWNTALPAVTPTTTAPQVGNTLSTNNGSWSPSSTTTSYTFAYQWRQCGPMGGNCKNIAGATSAQYTPRAADAGMTLRAAVTATNAYGSTTAASAPTPAVDAPPTNTALPVVTNQNANNPPQVGDTLATGGGTWAGYPTPTLAYAWYDCDATGANCGTTPIGTASTYTLASGDAGSTVRVTVTADNHVGTAASATSAPTSVVGAPENTALPMITDLQGHASPQPGDTLSTDGGSWSGATFPLAYQWQQCAPGTSVCNPSANQTSDGTYPVTDLDVGWTIRVLVTATTPPDRQLPRPHRRTLSEGRSNRARSSTWSSSIRRTTASTTSSASSACRRRAAIRATAR